MKKYFITVQTFASTTKLGRMVARKVFEKYHHSLITEDRRNEIAGFINEVMNDALKENPRLKPMTVTYYKSVDTFSVDLRPDAMKYDNYALSVTGCVVRNEYCGKGGGK